MGPRRRRRRASPGAARGQPRRLGGPPKARKLGVGVVAVVVAFRPADTAPAEPP